MNRSRFILAILVITCIFTIPLAACTTSQSAQTSILPSGQQVQPIQNTTGSTSYTTGAGTGRIEIHLTDAPPLKKEITSVMITISSIEVHTTGVDRDIQGTGDNTTARDQQQGGDTWIKINITGSNTVDLLKIKGLDQLFAVGDVKAGKYTQVRLVIANASVGFSDNTTSVATIPSGELKFVNSFDVIAGKTTVLTFDFDADKSINITGQDKVMIKPVIKLDVKQK